MILSLSVQMLLLPYLTWYFCTIASPQWNGINRQAPNLIFIDLDLSRFGLTSKKGIARTPMEAQSLLDRALRKTLRNIREKLDNVEPTVIWSGNGYHIYLPTDAFVLEDEDIFTSFENPSMKFLRFAEPYLTINKADTCHGNSLSFRNCMLRIPGSHNYKRVLRNNGKADNSSEVKIIRRWNGYRPAINWLLRNFRRYLIHERINDAFKDKRLKRKRSSYCDPTSLTTATSHSIHWVDSLLETQIEDHRKYALWRILAPYLISIRKLSYDQAYNIMRDWLHRCSEIRQMNFNIDHTIKDKLKGTIKVGYFPISLNDLKEESPELYSIIQNRIRNAKQ
jgi:Primase X